MKRIKAKGTKVMIFEPTLETGSVVPVHRHRSTSETVVVLRVRVVEEYYDEVGAVEAEFELAAGGPVCALNIPAGQWHTIRALESGTVILEMKDGAYEPIQTEDVTGKATV